jgi:hypothetical protein
MTEQIALKFPDGTRAHIKAVALAGESMTATLLRAIGQLQRSAPDPMDHDGPLVQIRADLASLAERVAALELPTAIKKTPTAKPRTRSAPVAQPDTDAHDRALVLKDQGLSYPEIATKLNAEGYRTPKGKPLNKDSVYRLLQLQSGTL